MNKHLKWAGNIWMGTSVENEDYISRIDLLRRTSAQIKFLSLEPLLVKLRNLNLKKIDWGNCRWGVGFQGTADETRVGAGHT